jgi:hypothetical protein
MAIPPVPPASVGPSSNWIARADPRPAPTRQQGIALYKAFVAVTSLDWLVEPNPGADISKWARLDPKAFTNAKALLNQHGAALRGPADGKLDTYLFTGIREVDVVTGRPPPDMSNDPRAHNFVPPVNSKDRARILAGIKTLKEAGYDMDAVTSPRVQMLVGLDITLARWKKLSKIDTGMLQGAPRVAGKALMNLVTNEVAAARKREFVMAVREYDRAVNAAFQAGLGRGDETTTFETLSSRVQQQHAAEERLHRAQKALQDLRIALHADIIGEADDSPSNWVKQLIQFQPHRP